MVASLSKWEKHLLLMQRKLKELWKFVEFIFSGIWKMLVTREPETNIILKFVLSYIFISCSASLTVFTLHKKCPYSELFWSAFSHIRTEYGEIRMWKNTEKMRTRITPNTDTLRSVNSWFYKSEFIKLTWI